ncbi:YkgJ family cysteine cluster protein [Candidatus Woesearchaeota archaeon]|nr:YkgJ family cysteine cluster protein [Candidatus Woesearchaeota archaeon]
MLKNFKCTRCGKCCYPPRLYPKDREKLRKVGCSDFIEKDFRGLSYIREQKNGKCAFLRKNKKNYSCKVYRCRPRICREYPTKLINGSCEPEMLVFDKYK